MSWAEQLPEYVENLRALLRSNEARFGLMVERQVQSQLLRKMNGLRAPLEPHLWSLLILCLDGHEAVVTELDDAKWARAQECSNQGTGFERKAPARFPAAARAIVIAMTDLRKYGVYPKPKLGT